MKMGNRGSEFLDFIPKPVRVAAAIGWGAASVYLGGCAAGQGAVQSLEPPTPASAPANPTGEPKPTTASEPTRKQETPFPRPSPTSAPVDIATGGTDPKSVISAEDLVQLEGMFGVNNCATEVGASNINGPENIVSLGRVPPEVVSGGVTFKLQEQAKSSGAIYVNEAGKQVVFPTVVQGAMVNGGRLFFVTKSVVCKDSETGGYSVRFADGDSTWRKDGSVSWMPVTVDDGFTASYDDLGNLVMRDANRGLKGVFVSDDPRDPDYGKWDRSPMAEPVRSMPTTVPSPVAPPASPTPGEVKPNVPPTAVAEKAQEWPAGVTVFEGFKKGFVDGKPVMVDANGQAIFDIVGGKPVIRSDVKKLEIGGIHAGAVVALPAAEISRTLALPENVGKIPLPVDLGSGVVVSVGGNLKASFLFFDGLSGAEVYWVGDGIVGKMTSDGCVNYILRLSDSGSYYYFLPAKYDGKVVDGSKVGLGLPMVLFSDGKIGPGYTSTNHELSISRDWSGGLKLVDLVVDGHGKFIVPRKG